MQDIIERLEKATGPDRELDEAIVLEVPITKGFLQPDKDGGFEVLHYTASIDAALTLVPEGWAVDDWFIGTDKSSCLDLLCVSDLSRRKSYGEHDFSPAIALCIAALKARAQASNPERT